MIFSGGARLAQPAPSHILLAASFGIKTLTVDFSPHFQGFCLGSKGFFRRLFIE
jgi:hypothetical protein